MFDEMRFVKNNCNVACMNYTFYGNLMFACNTLILTNVLAKDDVKNIDILKEIQPDLVVKDIFEITGSDVKSFLLHNVIDINPKFLYQIHQNEEIDQEVFNFFNNIGKGE